METSQVDRLQSAPAALPDVCVSDAVLLRAGGLPFSTTEALKSAAVGAAIEKSRWLETARLAKAQDISDLLHHEIGLVKGNAPLQHALLAVRRNIFNGRRPAAGDLVAATAALSEAAKAAIGEWTQLTTELEAHNQEAEQTLRTSVDDGRKRLKHLVGLPHFRKGLLLSSKSFERTLNEYIQSDTRKLDRKMRRTERTLLSYLFRTSHKTSPFSTFTPVCFVRLTDDPAHPDTPVLDTYEIRSTVKPNVGVLSRISQALTQNAVQFPHLSLSLQPGVTIAGNRLVYWKRNETPVAADGPVHTRVSEHMFWVHVTPSIEVLVAEMRARGSLTVAQIRTLLAEQLGVPEHEATEYVRLLVENGLLVVGGLRQSVFDPQSWERFTIALLESEDPTIADIGIRVHEVKQQVKTFCHVEASVRPALLDSIEAQVQEALDLAGSTAPLPRPVLFEDSTASDVALLVNKAGWTEAVNDLVELQRLFSLFDPLLIPKASMKSLFKKRFRATHVCTDILAFSDYFHEAFYRPYQQAAADVAKKKDANYVFGRGKLNPLKLPEITAILDARTDIAAMIVDALESRADADEVVIPSEWIDRFGSDMLALHKLLANSFFVQAAQHEDGVQFALNHVYGGLGSMCTRFNHLFPQTGDNSLEDALRANVAAAHKDPDTLFAQFQGGHDTNLNQHRLLTEYELLCPGEQGTAPAEKQIHITELAIRYDAQSDDLVLYCDRLQKRIIPLFLGLLYPLVLPELQTLLLHFAPPTVLRSELTPKRVPEGDAVLYHPRIRYKHVVLERAKWTVPIQTVPARANQETDYSYLLRLANWRLSAGIPQQVFAKLVPGEVHPENGQPMPAFYGATQQKPFYVDFENPFCVSLLEKVVADNKGYIYLTEMYPSSKEALLSHAGEAYVSECVLEITQRHSL